ncbi:MAG: DoxX family protein [Vicingaceae bacterium]
MDYLLIAIKLIVGLSILNVWLLRPSKSSPWRGGDANNMKEEFAAYNLPENFMQIIGTVKVALAVGFIASIWFEKLELYCGLGIAALMLGAVAMHIKIKDPLKKSVPALSFLILSLIVVLF